MKIPARALVIASLLSLPGEVRAEGEASDAMRLIQRLIGHYGLLVTRSFVDLTYDAMTVQPGTNDRVVTGLKLYPELPWDVEGACQITADRIAAGDVASFETLQSTLDISGVRVPAACFDPGVAGMMAAFGYDGLTADAMSVEIAYDLPRAAADVTVHVSVTDAADLSLAASFDYLWLRFPMDGPDDEPQPVAYLGEAELVIENNGLWEALEPTLADQLGDVAALPQTAEALLADMLSEGGTRALSPGETEFVRNLSTELARFIAEKNRLVLTVAPERAILLDEDAFASPAEAIAALQPGVSAVPVSFRRMIVPDELNAALNGGAGLDDDARLRIGEALITGIGAPRSVAAGAALLQPLADQWNARAALLIAQARAQQGAAGEGYPLVLRALAGGETAAIALADELETEVPVAAMLAAQTATSEAWPGGGDAETRFRAMTDAGDIAGLRRMAQAAAIGKGMPRDYEIAYFLASLAAAGGDRSAARLRDGFDRRFGDDPAWRKAAADAASEAVNIWTMGLGATIAERMR